MFMPPRTPLLRRKGLKIYILQKKTCRKLLFSKEEELTNIMKLFVIDKDKKISLKYFNSLVEQEKHTINYQNRTGRTALMYACLYVNEHTFEAAKLLIQNEECDLNIRDYEGYTALMYLSDASIITYYKIELARLLIEQSKVNLNLKEEYGNTALMLACYSKNYEIATFLIQDERCQLRAENYIRRNALDIASSVSIFRHRDFVDYLKAEIKKRGSKDGDEIEHQTTIVVTNVFFFIFY